MCLAVCALQQASPKSVEKKRKMRKNNKLLLQYPNYVHCCRTLFPFLLSIDMIFLTLHEQLQLNRRLKCIMHNYSGPIDQRYGLLINLNYNYF